ncbi:MAG TPA: T9SS type A sorting domain-containing protein, partial [Tenuifilaceae bacterium]|nr:T9SS type A sorting domain-containing protein [Tenuifilaceae bacterium]
KLFHNYFAGNQCFVEQKKKESVFGHPHFTNTGVTGSGDANQSVVALENQNDSDVIPMHYHTSSPANDPIYSLFPTSSTPREIFYGVSSLPFALINGSTPLSFSNFSANQNAVEISSLYDSPFSIDLDAQYEGSVDLDVRITSLGELTNEDLLLHCAIVKSEVNITESVASGETVFYNVVKQFLPNSGGVSLKGNWDLNEEQTFSVSWNPSSVSELSTTSMVVFIQNVNNKQVYQSESIDLSSLTSSPFDLQLTNVLLYPNPVTQNLIVDSPEVFYSMSIHDITGRAIWSRNYNEKYASIPVAWLKNGVYLLTIEFNNQRITRRFVKQ